MKRAFFLLFILSTFFLYKTPTVNSVYAQTGFNTILEYCTGTWCQWCPCGHQNVQAILQNYPNTMVLAYHGAGSDPWQSYTNGIRSLFGFTAYPSGVVGRRTGIINYASWNNPVVIQSNTVQPGTSIQINNFSYNSGTRTVTANIVATALTNLTGTYNINFVLTEDNLIYPQTGNSSCPGGSNYEHDHVVKGMINGDLGQAVNTGGSWNQGVQYTIPFNYVIPAGFVEANCNINVFIYKTGGPISTDNHIQQTYHFNAVSGPTGISNTNENELPTEYILGQNYPNPFNPSTSIVFSIPKNTEASLKVYDATGAVVFTSFEGQINAGTYNAAIDASSWTSGVYFYTLSSPDFVQTRKMVLVK